jgi:hypothetical protein
MNQRQLETHMQTITPQDHNTRRVLAKPNDAFKRIAVDRWIQLVCDAAAGRNVQELRLACAVQEATALRNEHGYCWPIWRDLNSHFQNDKAGYLEYRAKLLLALQNVEALKGKLTRLATKKDQG